MDQRKLQYCSDRIFNDETLYRTDYKKLKIKEAPKRTYIPKPEIPERTYSFPPDYAPKYIETMTRWKNCIAPFNLYVRPNPVRCDPRVKQEPYERPGDPERELAQKMRPRLVMTPAASLDDIDNPENRSILIEDMYMSTLNSAQQPVAAVAFPVDKNVKSPLGNTYAPPKPVFLPKMRQPFVSPEWRMESTFWDRRQTRGYADSTAQFWLRKPLAGKQK